MTRKDPTGAESGSAGTAGTAGTSGADAAPTLEPWVRDLLRCPVTGATLVDGTGPSGEPELHSTDPDRPLAYPVRDGIPVLIADDARPF